MLWESIPYVWTSRMWPPALSLIGFTKDGIQMGMETTLHKHEDDIKFENVYSRVLRVDAVF